MIERKIRLSQTISPFGVGAIYDFRGESLVACDTTYWKGRGDRLESPRLAAKLGVDYFKAAPSTIAWKTGSVPRLPFIRFPSWMFCSDCRHMRKMVSMDEVEGEAPRCLNPSCKRHPQLVPMRFVQICEDGHLDDVDWRYWAHSRSEEPHQKQCKVTTLSFDTGRSAGLGSLRVECRTCGASRNLADISSEEAILALGIRCTGRQPWEKWQDRRKCDAVPRVVQRGASNVYFANVDSAIDIPPDSNVDAYSDIDRNVAATSEFEVIMSDPSGPIAGMLISVLADKFDTTADRVRRIVDTEQAQRGGRLPLPSHPTVDGEDLLTPEWRALLTPQSESNHRDRFITRHVGMPATDASSELLAGFVDKVALVTRLREVRALTGFSRYSPAPDGSGNDRVVKPDLGADLEWLPAIEVFGEGIFFTIAEEPLARWEQQASVAERVAPLRRRAGGSLFADRLTLVEPRAILLHTLAHLLIRRLSYETGYPAAAIRERIYAKTPGMAGGPQAGVLIYTAAGDYEGTLGGLVRMGEPQRFARTVLGALEDARWCSADPVCMEAEGQGFQALNLAACHACSLVAETSCAHWNLLLDRGLVVGTPDTDGFFARVIEQALQTGV